MAKKILVVDDEPHIVTMIESRLNANGYDVITAFDGQEGLKKAQHENPDLILLDVMMPKLTGYKVARLLKFDDKFKDIPIIMLTARSQEKDVQLGTEVGVNVYITKPFEAKLLIESIKKILGE
jgi:DNA-binding response OmpR family regulator